MEIKENIDVTGFQRSNMVEKIMQGIQRVSPLDQREYHTCPWCHLAIPLGQSFCDDECSQWDEANNNYRLHGELKLTKDYEST